MKKWKKLLKHLRDNFYVESLPQSNNPKPSIDRPSANKTMPPMAGTFINSEVFRYKERGKI
jgi:hypothetical protein